MRAKLLVVAGMPLLVPGRHAHGLLRREDGGGRRRRDIRFRRRQPFRLTDNSGVFMLRLRNGHASLVEDILVTERSRLISTGERYP